MSASDELQAYVGGTFEPTERTDRVRWVEVCVCGHLIAMHAPSIGGEYRLAEPEDISRSGDTVHKIEAMFGCVGAMRHPSFELITDTHERHDDGTVTWVRRFNPTCPCDEMRAVAAVDRPHRYFNQRLPVDRQDPTKHPFVVGMRAYRRRIAKLKKAMADDTGEWATAEFDRRFTWLKSRVCGISSCTVTDDVWPVFVTDTGDGRSELRCAKHR